MVSRMRSLPSMNSDAVGQYHPTPRAGTTDRLEISAGAAGYTHDTYHRPTTSSSPRSNTITNSGNLAHQEMTEMSSSFYYLFEPRNFRSWNAQIDVQKPDLNEHGQPNFRSNKILRNDVARVLDEIPLGNVSHGLNHMIVHDVEHVTYRDQ